MELEQIIQSFEEKINIIKLKKIDVIFSKLNPDQNDIIYLRNLQETIGQFMPEEADDLLKFFNTFSKQTGKNQMSRKYFYMNMMAAAQQNKFNINKMLYDDDINEIQKSLQNIRLKNRMQNSQLTQKSQIQQMQISTNCTNVSQNYGIVQFQKEDQYDLQQQAHSNLQKIQISNYKEQILQNQIQNNMPQFQQSNEQQNCQQNYIPKTDKTNQSFNQMFSTSSNQVNSSNNFLNNISSVQTTNISYIKNDDNQVIPHIEISLKNAISTPMIPDQGVKDQYLTSSESSAQKTLHTSKENQFSANKLNNNSFCNISAIQNVSQGDSALISQEDQENHKHQMNKRQEDSILHQNFAKNKQQNSNSTRFITNKSNKHSQSSERNNILQKSQQNNSAQVRENINNTNVLQQINNQNLFQNCTKSNLQQSIYEQVLKQKKPEQNINQQVSQSKSNQPGIVSTSIHQDSLIKIISRDKIIKDFKENFRGKENFCDDFMELESTIRRLEKTNHSPTNSQLNKTAQHEGTTNCDTQLQHLNNKQQVNQSSFQFFSNDSKNNKIINQIQINQSLNSIQNNNQREHTPKVLKNISNSSSNIKIKNKVNQEYSNSKQKNLDKSLSNSKISKSSQKNKDQSQKENTFSKNTIDSSVRRVTRSTSANIIDKKRNQSKSPSQEKMNQKQTISRKISSDQIPSYLKEKERSLSQGRREEKTPIKFLDFKQKQMQNKQSKFKSQKIKQNEQEKENIIEKLTHPKVYSSVSQNKENEPYVQVLKNSQIQNEQQIKLSQNANSSNQQKLTTAAPRSNGQFNSIKQSFSIDRIKKINGYQEQFNKKKQQQQIKSSRNHSISIAQGSSQENSICGQKKSIDANQNQQQQFPDKVIIPNFLIKDASSCEAIQLEEENPQKNLKKIDHSNLNQSPQYQQYFEKIIMQDEKISKYFTTQNDDENSQYINNQIQPNYIQSEYMSKKQSHHSSKMSDHSTLREQKFEALEGITLDQESTSIDLKEKKSSRELKNKHETIYNLMINEDLYQSKQDEESLQCKKMNNINFDEKQNQQYQLAPPQFGGYNNYNSNQSQQNNLQKSFLDSPSQFLEVLKTKIEEDESNEFIQVQMENLKKIQQEKQKLIQEEAQMLQQLQKSQLSKVSSRNSLSNSIQSQLSINKQAQLQQGAQYNLKQFQDKASPGLPLPQKQSSIQQQNLSQQQQQLRSSYYSNSNNKPFNQQNQQQNGYQSQKVNSTNKQLSNLEEKQDNIEYNNAKEVQSIIFQNSNYNSLSSQREVQGSIDSGYNYTSNAAQKYSANSNSQQQSFQNQIDFQNFYSKQVNGSIQNLNSQPVSSYPNNQNSSLNFSFTDS
ncbi:hypothetical protein TTHERM_00446140 (macronuclear) [Tetrahymena thermophila SB210]|uniref:Uncharacterized protein n=1 Tax=Tetrahymena thermophila (strain SB210) TaxID=312017 RepID=I7M3H0_TETTS|nr:hypothetical protein TTHERM_00446140 [Tetrahymena thermophila SB210]EAS03133.2 hypothetical protein TTHERM_00446140 [Tetrahymena thermophila SB210]|eukprot:XP_001023378.2 hypothetical protein TTHERM_00446140 [Tetrahymena thermophila SB210]